MEMKTRYYEQKRKAELDLFNIESDSSKKEDGNIHEKLEFFRLVVLKGTQYCFFFGV